MNNLKCYSIGILGYGVYYLYLKGMYNYGKL